MDYRVVTGTLFIGHERFTAGTSSAVVPAKVAEQVDVEALLKNGTLAKVQQGHKSERVPRGEQSTDEGEAGS